MRRLSRMAVVASATLALACATALPAAAAARGPGPAAPGTRAARDLAARDLAARHQAARHRGRPAGYYLALGDSLSVGDQPDAEGVTVPTPQGYPDQLAAMLAGQGIGLRLVKLGCPGETTATMIGGGICGYAGDHRYSLTADKGSQLAAALAFLRAHRGHVPLITIDIGANDLNPCVTLGSISAVAACARPVIETAGKNAAVILAALRAADPRAVIAGMTYYVPELAQWLTGPAGQAFAQGAIPLAEALNGTLAADFAAEHVIVADVFTAFRSADITDMVYLPGVGTVPRDVAMICELTWECDPPPVGPNEHANDAGYRLIAATFATALRGSGAFGCRRQPSSSLATSSQRSSRAALSARTALSSAPSAVSFS